MHSLQVEAPDKAEQLRNCKAEGRKTADPSTLFPISTLMIHYSFAIFQVLACLSKHHNATLRVRASGTGHGPAT